MIKGIPGQLSVQINTEKFSLLQTGIYASSRWAYFEIEFFLNAVNRKEYPSKNWCFYLSIETFICFWKTKRDFWKKKNSAKRLFFFNRKEFFFFCRVIVALNNFLVTSVIKCKRFLALEKKKMHYRKMCS